MRNCTEGFFTSAIDVCICPVTISDANKTKTQGEKKTHRNSVWFVHKTINCSQPPWKPAPSLVTKQASKFNHLSPSLNYCNNTWRPQDFLLVWGLGACRNTPSSCLRLFWWVKWGWGGLSFRDTATQSSKPIQKYFRHHPRTQLWRLFRMDTSSGGWRPGMSGGQVISSRWAVVPLQPAQHTSGFTGTSNNSLESGS